MDIKCPKCNKVRDLESLRIMDGELTCLCCHTGMSEELAEEFAKCGRIIMASADKIRNQIDQIL